VFAAGRRLKETGKKCQIQEAGRDVNEAEEEENPETTQERK
jgi:hypothetical protein